MWWRGIQNLWKVIAASEGSMWRAKDGKDISKLVAQIGDRLGHLESSANNLKGDLREVNKLFAGVASGVLRLQSSSMMVSSNVDKPRVAAHYYTILPQHYYYYDDKKLMNTNLIIFSIHSYAVSVAVSQNFPRWWREQPADW